MITQLPQLTFTLVDASGSLGNTGLWIAEGTTVADAASAAAMFRVLAAPITDAVFTRQAIIYRAVESPKPAPADSADGTRFGVFIFSCGVGVYAVVGVPGIKDSAIIASGDGAGLLIDRDNTDVAALVAELVSGFWCNPFGHTILTLESAFLQIRR